MKLVKGLLVAGIAVVVLAGCGNNANNANEAPANEPAANQPAANQPAENQPAENQPDVVTTASIVNEAEAFINSVGEKGTWITATLGDLTIDKDVVVVGEFHDKNDPAAKIYRKIGLYTQDADHNITASFTLTVPKLTVQSENLRVQGGTIKGDVYVEANGFSLHESATVDGNLYFASEDVKATAVVDGKVTGANEVK